MRQPDKEWLILAPLIIFHTHLLLWHNLLVLDIYIQSTATLLSDHNFSKNLCVHIIHSKSPELSQHQELLFLHHRPPLRPQQSLKFSLQLKFEELLLFYKWFSFQQTEKFGRLLEEH